MNRATDPAEQARYSEARRGANRMRSEAQAISTYRQMKLYELQAQTLRMLQSLGVSK